MSKPFSFEKPLGMRDILPEMVRKKQVLLHTIDEVVHAWGYDRVETPTLEYYDTVGGVSATMDQKMFKLLDPSGRTLVLRPDLTAPIARVVGSLLKERPFPIRLSYQGNVFRAQEQEAGRNSEFPEVGVELIGEDAPDADAEVIALAIASIQRAGVSSFTFTLGHIGLVNAYLSEVIQDEEMEQHLKSLLNDKNVVGYRQYVHQAALSQEQKDQLFQLLSWRGAIDQLKINGLPGEQSKQALEEICTLWEVLKLHDVHHFITFDLSLMSHRNYYTGIFFEGYVHGLGFPVASGGRYDHLLAEFDRPAPATGFSLKVDRLLEASPSPSPSLPEHVLLVYTEEDRQQAFQQARQWRADGARVTLHRQESKEDTFRPEKGQENALKHRASIENRYDRVIQVGGDQRES